MVSESLFSLFTQGLILGLSIAAPVGPIGVLCIRRSLQNGFKSGLVSGLGAASADAIYGTIAAAGLTLAADFLARQQIWLGLLGGAFLVYLGVQTFRSPPPAVDKSAVTSSSAAGDYFSTFLLTLSNPVTVFSFLALFGGLSAGSGADFHVSAFVLVAGVFIGSALWWLLLSTLVSVFRTRFSTDLMRWVNRIAGVIILGFALVMLWQAAKLFLG